MSNYIIKCITPPTEWLEGFPTGNGRLASMLWGEKKDIISLNHEWLWTGLTRNRDNNTVPSDVLPQIRNLIEQKDFFKATAVANAWLGGHGGISGLKNRIDSFQPAGDLCFESYEEYDFKERELNLLEGIASSKRINSAGNTILAQNYVDLSEDVIVCRWSSIEPFGGELSFVRENDERTSEEYTYNKRGIIYRCSFNGGASFCVRISVKTDGIVSINRNSLSITNAREIIAIADICIDRENNSQTELKVYSYDYSEMFVNHIKNFSENMKSFELEFDAPENNDFIEKRIKAMQSGASDENLILLFFNYGRYLMFSSSLRGELPANLQGKWNHELFPLWNSDYHFNINLQMNYWFCESLGMGECVENLLNLIDIYIPHGKKAAKDLYGCRGVWFPHAGDVWGRCTPESYGYGVWIGAAAWLAQHCWQRYIYSVDRELLEKRVYPFLKEVALFYVDYVTLGKDGKYEISPSQSPENAFLGVGCFFAANCKSSAMDVQLAYDALGYAIKAARILNTDTAYVAEWTKIRENLPKFNVGSDGRLLEWNEEFVEKEPSHRHLSHLYGLYPSKLFTNKNNKEQYEACRKSLDFRMSAGGGHTGWSRAWVACLYAALGDGEKAYEHIEKLITEFSTSSLLDIHPLELEGYSRIFQIDGNFGAVAAITETLANYSDDGLTLLPALPKRWKNGMVRGFKTPGGHTVSFKWQNEKVNYCEIIMGYERSLTLFANGMKYTLNGCEGERIRITI